MVRLFFEQSGTFKNEFIKLGFPALDYDLFDSFSCTDFRIDLFHEIYMAYFGFDSIFDSFSSDDLIFAFFPCTRFESFVPLMLRCEHNGLDKLSDLDKLKHCIDLHSDIDYFYRTLCQLVYICLDRGFKLIVENPYHCNFLLNNWCFRPSIVDMDRRIDGDYYKKPTMYYFFNFEPSNNFLFEGITYNGGSLVCHSHGIQCSLISPQYANRFIRKYILSDNF